MKVVDTPEKWAGESAVILYKHSYYEYTNNGRKRFTPSYTHQRIKVLDKAAIEYFSELNYDQNESYGTIFRKLFQDNTILGVKIVKPNGDENILDIKSETVTQDNTNKIAIPGLEIGDVIDIFIYEDDFLKDGQGYQIYPKVENVLSARYPTLYYKTTIEVENDFFLNMETYNGAPEVKEVPTDRKATRRYVLEAEDLEKNDFPRWFYPLVELPSVKFQVTFAFRGDDERDANAFLSKEEASRKTKVTKDEIVNYYADRFDAFSRGDIKRVRKYLEEKGIINKREQIVQGFYFLRHQYFNKFIELVVMSENGISSYAQPCDGSFLLLTEKNFISYVAGMAKEFEIDYDIIVATADYNGPIDDLLLQSNVTYGLRLNFPKPLHFFDLSYHAQPEYFPENLEDTKVYVLSVKNNRKIEDAAFDRMPKTEASDNISKESIAVSIKDGFEGFDVKRTLEYSGHFKIEEANRRVFLKDFLDEEFVHFDNNHTYNCKKRQKDSEKILEDKLDAVYAKIKKNRIESMKERAASNFGVDKVEDYDYSIIDASRYSKAPLAVEDTFVLGDDFVKRAGPNYLIEVGKFIGGQVQIDDDERIRTSRANTGSAKTYEYSITLDIPDGYEIVGLDKLQFDVGNATGSFVSDASVQNGKLTVMTKKVYAKKFFEASEWSSMLEWLDAGYSFSQVKVMFKKL